MAEKYPTANGNWSTAANWNGGTLPQPGDVVHANGRTIQIDQNINVASIRTTAGATAVAGGVFNIGVGGSTLALVCDVIAGSTTCLVYAATGGTLSVTGNISGSATTSARHGISHGSTGALTVNGNVTAGTLNTAQGIDSTASGALTVNGNVTAGTAVTCMGINASGAKTVTVNGDVRGGSGNQSRGVGHSAGSLIINGDVYGGTVGGAPGVHLSVSSLGLTLTGNVYGAQSPGIQSAGAATLASSIIHGNVNGGVVSAVDWSAEGTTLAVDGDVLGGPTSNGYGISVGVFCTVVIDGSLMGGTVNGAHGFNANSNADLYVETLIGAPPAAATNAIIWAANSFGDLNVYFRDAKFGTGGRSPFGHAHFWLETDVSNTITMRETTLGPDIILGEIPADYPAETDVRDGIVYAFGAMEGSVKVPGPGAVALGVEVDNTVGTAILTQQAIADAVGPLAAAYGP